MGNATLREKQILLGELEQLIKRVSDFQQRVPGNLNVDKPLSPDLADEFRHILVDCEAHISNMERLNLPVTEGLRNLVKRGWEKPGITVNLMEKGSQWPTN